MPDLTLPVYYNKVDELIPFNNQEAAHQWLSDLDTSGTPILVPFKDKFNQIHFLKPGITKDSNHPLANENFRIMGAANEIRKTFWDSFKRVFVDHYVPHLNNIEGEIISIAEHGFIVIYERGNENAGKKFFELFQKEKKDLLAKIEVTQTNEGAYLNETKFIQDLSQLAMDLKIISGMCYFLIKKKDETHIYRHTFKQDPTNTKIEAYLHKENEWHKSEHKIVENNKSQNHHILSFLKDWLKWTVFATLTAIGAGLILGIFISPPIGTIAAALVAVVTFISASSYGFYRADLNNATTTEFNNTEFVAESGNTFSFRIKQRCNSLLAFFNRKLTNTSTSDLSIVNGNNLATAETEKPISILKLAAKPNGFASSNTNLHFFPVFPEGNLATQDESNSNKKPLLRNNAI